MDTTNPEALAEHAIRLVAKRLEARGVRVRIGMELEFTMALPSDAPSLRTATTNHDPLQLGKGRDRTLFPQSRFVSASYREQGTHNPRFGSQRDVIRQYEIVTDYRHPMPLDRLPAALNALREELRQPVGSGMPAAPTQNGHMVDMVQQARSTQQQWCQKNVSDIRFDTQPRPRITNGLHLNFSIAHAATGASLMQGPCDRVNRLQRVTHHLFRHEKTLLAYAPGQKLRWDAESRHNRPDIRLKSVHRGGLVADALNVVAPHQECYLENRCPGADCNPHYALMLQMLAIHEAETTERSPATVPPLETLLNELEPGLGTRFVAAEAAQPEKRAYSHAPAQARGRA